MQKKTAIILSIAVVVLAVVLLVVHFKSSKKEESSDKTTVENNLPSNLPSNNAHTSETQDDKSVTVTQNGEGVTVTQENQNLADKEVNETDDSGREAQKEDILAVPITIVDMQEEVKADIKDMDAFEYAIKQFFYETGIMEEEVRCMNKISHDYRDKRISYQMYVSSSTVTYFDVVYETETGKYSVLY